MKERKLTKKKISHSPKHVHYNSEDPKRIKKKCILYKGCYYNLKDFGQEHLGKA